MGDKEKIVSGIGWNGGGNVVRQISQLVTMIVLARLISPIEIGTYAILMVFVSFTQLLGNMGTAQVIVHLDSPDQRLLSSIFYLNIIMGAGLFFALFALAWPLSIVYENPDLVHLFQIISFSCVITALSSVQRTLLEKALMFRQIAMIETGATIISSIAGAASAFSGHGIYSLLVMTLVNASFISAGLWINSHWKPSWTFSFCDIRSVWRYTAELTGFGIINYFSRNADALLIGKYLGAPALGLYSLAYRVMLYPLSNISGVVARVLFPAFSQMRNDDRLFRIAYLQAITYIGFLTFPMFVGVFAVAERMVPVIFGVQWLGMAPLLMILAPIGIIQSVVVTVGTIYMSKGTTSLMLKIGSANALVTVVAFICGLPFGVLGVASAYAVVNLAMLYINLKLAWDQIDLSVAEGVFTLAPYLGCSVLMGIGIWCADLLMASMGVNNVVILSADILVGVILYFCAALLFKRDVVVALMKALSNRTQTPASHQDSPLLTAEKP